ncbi:MAG: hypothetical protein ACE5IR_25800 [bacterium]
MKYTQFKNRVRGYPVISGRLLDMLGEDRRILQNQLSRWRKQGLIIQLRRGLYLLNREDRAIHPSPFFLANQLVFPSYVSLEAALAFYHIIPETVYQVTSVTTQKPGQFDTPAGSFRYRHVKPLLHFGFESVKDEAGLSIHIASPEKALLDFFYLNLAQFSISDRRIFEDSFRLHASEALQL